MSEPSLCQGCNRPEKTYLNGRCFNCSMTPTDPPVLSFTVSEEELDDQIAKGREVTQTGYAKDLPWPGAWTFSSEKLERVLAQVRHIKGQIEEAIALRTWDKVLHAEASVAELLSLLPDGGAQ